MVSSWDGEQMVEVCGNREVGLEVRGVDVGGLEDATRRLQRPPFVRGWLPKQK